LVSIEKIKASDFLKNISGKNKVTISHVSKIYRQQLTHQTIQGVFVHIKLKNEPQLKAYKTVTYNKLNKLPFPKLITGYLSENEWKKFER